VLINELFNYLLLVFENEINNFIANDIIAINKFTRAYIKATTSYCNNIKHRELIDILAFDMAMDENFSKKWKSWLQQQLKKHGENENSVSLNIARYAADGIWLEDCTGAGRLDEAGRNAVIEHLIGLTETD
jgi:hypothetical protein